MNVTKGSLWKGSWGEDVAHLAEGLPSKRKALGSTLICV